MSDRERQVRDEAYRLWDEAGRPQGRDDELWYEAEKRVGAETAPTTAGGKTRKAAGPAADGVVAVANDRSTTRAKKGEAVEIAPAGSKKKAAGLNSGATAAKSEAKPKSKA